jgi:membrane associated rhomboid family serine protease
MDWSLVLISQGIESEIIQDEGDSKWSLLVAPGDSQNAIAAIRQYVIENRGWPWRTQVLRPGLLFDWGSLAWVFLVVLFFALDSRGSLRGSAIMNTSAVAAGQWWRLFTAMWLHGDISHLATNVIFGFVLLGLNMGQLGTGTGLLSAYLAGAGGNVIAWMISSDNVSSLGASGMIMGSVGLLSIGSLSLEGEFRFARRYMIAGLAAGLLLFVLLGLNPGSYVQAHFGGFLIGLLLGLCLRRNFKLVKSTPINVACGLIFTLLVIVPWGLALLKS